MYTSPSGKSYIGQTKHPLKRQTSHKNLSSGSSALINAIKKYGWENMTYTILVENISEDDANLLEEKYINEYKTLHPHGYNLVYGGGNKTPSLETRNKISLSKMGTVISESQKLAQSIRMKGNKNPFYGKSHDSRSKEIIGETNSKLWEVIHPDGKKEICFGLAEICKKYNLDAGAMGKIAKGIWKSHKGFTCSYIIFNNEIGFI